jgi:hypothetical protein
VNGVKNTHIGSRKERASFAVPSSVERLGKKSLLFSEKILPTGSSSSVTIFRIAGNISLERSASIALRLGERVGKCLVQEDEYTKLSSSIVWTFLKNLGSMRVSSYTVFCLKSRFYAAFGKIFREP